MTGAITHSHRSGGPPKILVVDDDRITRRAMQLMLEKQFDISLAANGMIALDMIRGGDTFDVVSLDLRMPGMSGIETLQEIKRLDPAIEVLLVTAYSDVDAAKQALKSGAYDYIDKPIVNSTLRAAIRKGVDRRARTTDSERARRQLATLRAKLVHTEKLSAIGEMLAGVVHEINNPLNVILGFSDLLLTVEYHPAEAREHVRSIRQAAGMCQRVIDKVLDFSRKTPPRREPVHLAAVMDDTLALKSVDLRKNRIVMEKTIPGHLPAIMADAGQLQQVFINLIGNAQQAMGGQSDPKSLAIRIESAPPVVRIYVQDNGPGIPPENHQKIFEPFFTTKETGKGTGLGLSVCYDIIKDHQGDIYISSEPGKGACFIIELPVHDSGQSPAPAENDP